MEIEAIILRYLDNSATREEKQTLLDWLKKSEAHRDDFVHTRDLWLSSNAALGTDLEVDLALERFRERLRSRATHLAASCKVPSRRFNTGYLVAVLLLLLLVGGALWKFEEGFLFGKEITVLITAPNSKGHFKLPDGSEVWLNKESQLSFIHKNFGQHREVVLDGEAYFEIKKSTQSPFTVKMNELDVEVLGTSFNATHYPNDSCIEVTLNKGAIQLVGEKLPQAVTLKPGDRFVYNKQSHVSLLDHTNPYYYSIWKEEQLEFDNHPLSEIIPCLETWYRIQINCPSQLDSTRLTFTVRNENPDEIMRYIGYIAPIQYKMEKNIMTIQRK